MLADLFENLVRSVTDFGLERVFKRYYSTYRAEVTSNSDPDHRGRVKLKIPMLFGDDELPYYAEPKDDAGANAGKGKFNPPYVGDTVYVEFEFGRPTEPIYTGGTWAEDELPDVFTHDANDQPQVRGMVSKYGFNFIFSEEEGKQKVQVSTPAGHYLVLDDTAGAEALFLIHKTGAQLQMDKDGSAKVISSDGALMSLDAVSGAASVTSKDGSTAVLKDDIVLLPKGGDSMLRLAAGIAQLTSAKDVIVSGNTYTLSAGAVTLDVQGATLKMGAGKVAIGAGGTELIDTTIKFMDALLQSPSLCVTGTGPSGPLSPPAAVQIGVLKGLLTAIMGTL